MAHAPPTLIDSSPPDGGWPDHPLFGLENIYRAYRQCRRHKRGTINALRFERYLEDNLVALSRELQGGTYRPGRFLAFLLEKPKRREIFAADFRRSSPGSAVERRLWQSGVAVAWIGETGRRLTDIAERALVCRWAGGDRGDCIGEPAGRIAVAQEGACYSSSARGSGNDV